MGTTQGNKEKHSKLIFTLFTALGNLQLEIPRKVITWHKACLPLTTPVKSTLDPKIFKQKMSECKPGTALQWPMGHYDPFLLGPYFGYIFSIYFIFHSPLFLLILKSFVISALLLHLVKVERERKILKII